MSVEEQWAQLKQQPSAGSELHLASADGGTDGGADAPDWERTGSKPSGGITSSKTAWTQAAEGIGALSKNIPKAMTELEREQPGSGPASGAGSTSSGVQSAAAQQDVYRSWKRYLQDVSERCSALQERLDKAGNDQYKTDQAIRGAFNRMADAYEDTPAVGGSGGADSGQRSQSGSR